MDSFWKGVGDWFNGIVSWAAHQTWLMELMVGAVIVLFIIAIFSDD